MRELPGRTAGGDGGPLSARTYGPSVPRVVPRFLVVLFDLDGTLVDLRNFAQWAELARRWAIDVDEYHLAHAYLEVEREYDRPPPVPVRSAWWREVLSRASHTEVPDGVGEKFLEAVRALPPAAQLFSDTRRCLDGLAGDGRRFGVISNSRSEAFVRDVLRNTGIQPYFEAVVSSGTEGVEKPDPAIFHRAVARLGALPSAAFYVGDLAYTDARAARAAGLESVWLHRDGTGFGDDPAEITSLTELPGYLRRIEHGSTR